MTQKSNSDNNTHSKNEDREYITQNRVQRGPGRRRIESDVETLRLKESQSKTKTRAMPQDADRDLSTLNKGIKTTTQYTIPAGPSQTKKMSSSNSKTFANNPTTRHMPSNMDRKSSRPSQDTEDVPQKESPINYSQQKEVPSVYSSRSKSTGFPATRNMPSNADIITITSHQDKERVIAQSRFFKEETDVDFAERQTRFESLSPQEQQAQEKWALYQLSMNFGKCLLSFDYVRIKGGYRCKGGSHIVSDELLAEGRGRYYITEFAGERVMMLIRNFNNALHQHSIRTSSLPGSCSNQERAKRMLQGMENFRGQGLHPSMLQNAANALKNGGPAPWSADPRGGYILLGPWSSVMWTLTQGGQKYSELKMDGKMGKNTLRNPQDNDMALRQLRVETLSPSEKNLQDTWARGQLKMNGCGANSWTRIEEGFSGYISSDRKFKVTDELLAEGLGGFYTLIRSPPLGFLIADGPRYKLSSSGNTIEQSLAELNNSYPEPKNRILERMMVVPTNKNRRGLGGRGWRR